MSDIVAAMTTSDLPLKRLGRGKVRDIYEVDADRLLLVATDRISAFDVVMNEAIPFKGAVLTQISAWWFSRSGASSDFRQCRRDHRCCARTCGASCGARGPFHAVQAHDRLPD